jgi:isopentenyl diphosphate isomerase/L-lactate dehydrogenase-like FMN-dependent dehydrogenase
MKDRDLPRRRFLGLVAAATAATACRPDDPCGTHNPWRWLSSADAETAAHDILGADAQPWESVEGPDERVQRFMDSLNLFALRPRILVDVRVLDLGTSLLGRPLATPLLIAPGVSRIPDAGIIDTVAEAASALEVPFLCEAGHVPRNLPPGLHVNCIPWYRTTGLSASDDTVVGGVRTVDDALEAARRGARAILISNGGRSDAGPSSLELLPAIRQALPADVQLIVEGAFRHANGILIALGLGATAVTLGWPPVWAAVSAGLPGAFRSLDLLRLGLARGMRLCGRTSERHIGPDLVRREPIV